MNSEVTNKLLEAIKPYALNAAISLVGADAHIGPQWFLQFISETILYQHLLTKSVHRAPILFRVDVGIDPYNPS